MFYHCIEYTMKLMIILVTDVSDYITIIWGVCVCSCAGIAQKKSVVQSWYLPDILVSAPDIAVQSFGSYRSAVLEKSDKESFSISRQ